MPQRVQTLRSSTKNTRPTTGTREVGELYTNLPDKQIGVIDAGKVAMDLVAVRFFSATTNYVAGDYVHNAGHVYRANKSIVAGAFNPTDWDTAPTAGEYEPPIAAGTIADYWRGDKSWQTLNKSAVGLGAVDNTSDASKPVSTATQTALNLKADLASPTFTGDPKAPTASPGDNDTSIATTAFTTAAIAVSDAAQVTALNLKANIASPTFTGDPKAPTPSAGDNDTSIATTQFVTSAISTATAPMLPDAPADGFVYGRKNNLWATVIGGAHTDDNPPAGPLQDGQLWYRSSDGAMFIWYVDTDSGQWIQVNGPVTAAGTAEARNRIVNGAMQISQENGNTAGTVSAYYAADQWVMLHASTATITSQRVQVATPNGSRDRLRYTVTVADAALAAGDYLQVDTRIEGTRMADFLYGTASAKQSILRFGFKGPAGTYSIVLNNSGNTRSYITNFTVSAGQANTDTVQTFILPGDTAGTWLVDTGLGLHLAITLAAGTTYQGAVGWQSGNYLGTSANSNGMATAGAVYELYDCGLYIDPLNTGVAPRWEMPDEADELLACQRYYNRWAEILVSSYQVGGLPVYGAYSISPTMRIVPAVALTGTPFFSNASGSGVNVVTQTILRIQTTVTATGVGLLSMPFCSLNARM